MFVICQASFVVTFCLRGMFFNCLYLEHSCNIFARVNFNVKANLNHKNRVLVTVQSNNYGAFDFQVFSFVNNFKEDYFIFMIFME